jgi:hypothetical protein
VDSKRRELASLLLLLLLLLRRHQLDTTKYNTGQTPAAWDDASDVTANLHNTMKENRTAPKNLALVTT